MRTIKTIQTFCLCLLAYCVIGRSTYIVSEDKSISISYYDMFRNHHFFKLNTNEPKELNLSSPQFYYFASTEKGKPIIRHFFALPGDSIIIKKSGALNSINDRILTEYELLNEFTDHGVDLIFSSEGSLSKINDFDTWKNEVFLARKERLRILESNRSSVRSEYYQLLKQLIDVKYIEKLVFPYNDCSPYVNFTPEHNSDWYFDTLNMFNSELNEVNSNYLNALSGWLVPSLLNLGRYYARELSNSDLHFANMFENGTYKFSNHIRDLYLSLLMQENINNDSVREGYFTVYKNLCTDRKYIEQVESHRINSSEIESDIRVLETKLSGTDASITSWKSLLDKHSGKVIYVDFWASWCAGCKINMPHLEKLKTQFPEIVIILISNDESSEKWKTTIEKWGNQDIGVHYWVDPDTHLAEKLSKPSIPRHTLINKFGKIVSIDADPPYSQRLRDVLADLN